MQNNFMGNFEEEGLKINKERVLTYSQLSCPFDCAYCFVEDLNFNQQEGVSYLSDKQFELLGQLPENIKLVMLGCDTEFFQSKDESLDILNKLSKLNKDISVVTKMYLGKDFLGELKEIDSELNKNGHFFAFSETIPCLESSQIWEPKVVSPAKRIETIKNAYESRIKTLIAIRPLLPNVSKEELKEIILLTKDYCLGYYSGPLYMKNLEHPVLRNIDLTNLNIEEIQPHWMPEGNIFYKIEDKDQSTFLKEIVESSGKKLVEGAAEAVKYIKEYEKY